ncbi:MAG: Sb-PDE family phosphodiesterase, partial [Lutibacter sp.]|nr:Sb-PDE family phosphodiesterase [Lutibacter sp.]
NSDVHGITDWLFDIPAGKHRPMTFVLAEIRDKEAIKAALKKGKTVVWFKDLLIGKTDNLLPVLYANLSCQLLGYKPNGVAIARVQIRNHSALPIHLEYLGPFTFHRNSRFIQVPAYGSLELHLKTLQRLDSFQLPFKVLNALTAPKQHPSLYFQLVAGE